VSSSSTAGKRFGLDVREAERLLSEAAAYKGESLWNDAWRRLKRDRGAMVSLWFLAVFVALSVLAPALPLPSPIALELSPEPQPPVAPWADFGNHGFAFDFQADADYRAAYWELTWLDKRLVDLRCAVFGDWQTGKWCGTDSKGRDLLSRIVWGSRTSILVAVAATLCSLVIGVTYGAFSGLAGRRTDNLMMRFVDILYSIPFIFVVIFVLTILSTPRSDLEAQPLVDKEKVFFLVIGAIYWLTMARVVRGQVLSLKNSEFIEAARVMGASTARVLFVHVVPNVLSIVIVYLTLTIPAIMLFEAFLSFLGLGIEPPKVSWGLLAVDGTDAINPIKTFWWLVVYPAAAMGSTLLALNFLGDGLRDALDPKLRGKA
jgi:oligopeptide transport system permease protein